MGACCSEPIDFNGEVDLRHFTLQRSVGKGAFGKVRIVRKKNDRQIYALKYINKAKCVQMKAVNHIIQERRLLEDIRHPFIVNLRYAFQDDENLFMVLDLMLGGDLRFHLERLGVMKEEAVRHFGAEIGRALQYLHSKRIVHRYALPLRRLIDFCRDLKPDNILLDEKGHAHITDFNIAVRYTEGTPLKSVAGSMVYMAPEVLGKKGYYSSPDLWSLGVTMYELLFGRRPFRGKTNDQLISSILHDPVHPPSTTTVKISDECKDLLFGLLERDISVRLGCGQANWDLFTNHAFFAKSYGVVKSIKWPDLDEKKVPSPYVPDASRSNFDASHELEELLLEENPLRAKKRSSSRDYSKYPGGADGEVANQMRLMERKFTVFDYKKTDSNGGGNESAKSPLQSTEVLHLQIASVKKSLSSVLFVNSRSTSEYSIKASKDGDGDEAVPQLPAINTKIPPATSAAVTGNGMEISMHDLDNYRDQHLSPTASGGSART